MDRSDTPLWYQRVGLLAMTWAWSIIAFGVAINAQVKSNQDKDRVRELAPLGSVVNIDDSDAFQTGAVLTAICIILFVVTSVYLATLLVLPTKLTSRPRIIAFQSVVLAFLAVWLFATLVPYTHFIRTRSAKISATIGGIPISSGLINELEKQLGLTSVYHEFGYLRLVAILPWITLLFTIMASVVTFMAASRSLATQSQPVADATKGPSEADTTNEKVDADKTADHDTSPV